MLEFAIISLVIAVIAGALGFTGVARGAAMLSWIIFGIFLVLALILFLVVWLGARAVGG